MRRRVNQQMAVMNSEPHMVLSAGKGEAGEGVSAFPPTADLPDKDRMR